MHHQQVFLDDEDEDEDEDRIWNTLSGVEHMNLRKPSNEEIERITKKMIAHMHSTYNLRNKVFNNNVGKSSGIFIKDITNKMNDENKKGQSTIDS